MIKKLLSISSLFALLLIISVSAFARQPELNENGKAKKFALPPTAEEVAPHVYFLGLAKDRNGDVLEGYAFIHDRDEEARANRGSSKGGTTCYAFLSSGARWKVTEPYLVNPANASNMDTGFVADMLAAATETWDTQVAFDIFGAGATTDATLEADSSSPDGVNEIYFGAVDDPRTIAVTTVWGIFGGSPKWRELREWDMVYNDVNYAWGDATTNPALMDLLNVAVHEVGHAAGMGHPGDSCTEESMFRFAEEGETKKRDLYTGDIVGIKQLYR